MKLSTSMILLSGLLLATTTKWSQIWDRRTISEIYKSAKAGKLRTTLYEKIIALVSVTLLVTSIYLALTWR